MNTSSPLRNIFLISQKLSRNNCGGFVLLGSCVPSHRPALTQHAVHGGGASPSSRLLSAAERASELVRELPYIPPLHLDFPAC